MNASTTTAPQVTIKFDQIAEQTVEGITSITGFVRARDFILIINALDLDANPRSAKVGRVTAAIRDSLENSPSLFQYKSKGVLLGATGYERLDRGRVRVTFEQLSIEGILDGGHNTLAIGLRILEIAGIPESKLRRVKLWSDLRELWDDSAAEVEALRRGQAMGADGIKDDRLDFYVKVELIVPENPDDEADVSRFQSSILEICEARNNNAELTEGAKGNKAGFFNDLSDFLPENVRERIEWVPGTVKPVKITDLIALAWLPLGLLDPIPTDAGERPISPPIPQNLYRNKGEAIEKFNDLMGLQAVTHERAGEAVLYNDRVRSALKVAATLPALYDRIYRDFPTVYNKLDGKYGRITAVAKMNTSPRAKEAKFTAEPVSHESPEGFIWPLVHGLQALIRQDAEGKIDWATDPSSFLDKHFESIVLAYKDVMQAMDFDPPKIGKAPLAYSTVRNAFILAGAGKLTTAPEVTA
jgi:hypothetical protein